MSSLSNSTSDIEIRHPERWTLILRVGISDVRFILYSDEEEDSLISRSLPLEMSGRDYLSALENCIYDNPVLIQDFKQVIVSVESSHFVVLPAEISDEDVRSEILDYMYANDSGECCSCEVLPEKVSMAYTMPKGVVAFLQRTFNMPKIVHHLVPLCTYSAIKSENSGVAKMFVHLYNSRMDLCAFRKGELQVANTFYYRNEEEAAYYILNAWQTYGMDSLADELQLTGDKSVRDFLMPLLRKYISYVMAIIFPASAMKLGQDAIKAPFDLILLSQCVL